MPPLWVIKESPPGFGFIEGLEGQADPAIRGGYSQAVGAHQAQIGPVDRGGDLFRPTPALVAEFAESAGKHGGIGGIPLELAGE